MVDFYNVMASPYNAVGDGTTDDASAIQSAVTAASTAGGGVVFVPGKTFLVGSMIDLKTNVTLMGVGPASVIKGKTGAAGSPFRMLSITGNNTTIRDITVDGGGHTNVLCVGIGGNSTTNTINFTTFDRMYSTRGTYACVLSYATNKLNDFYMENCVIYDTPYAVYITPPPGGGSTCFRMIGNTFRGMTTPILDDVVVFNGAGTQDTFRKVVIANNIFKDFDQLYGITLDVTGCEGLTVTGNVMGPTGSRGVSTGWNNVYTISGNSIEGQDVYAIELNGSQWGTITGNAVRNCKSFVQPSNPTIPVVDVTITGNTIVGTGYGATGTGNGILLHNNCARWLIANNTFTNSKSAGNDGVIKVGEGAGSGASHITISDNTYYAIASDSDVNFVTVRYASYTRISGNTVNILRNVDAAFNDYAAIYVAPNSGVDHVDIDNNIIRKTGGGTATSYHGIDDGGASSYSAPTWSIRRNYITGFNKGMSFANNTGAMAYESNDSSIDSGNGATDAFNGAARFVDPVEGTVVVPIRLGDWNRYKNFPW